MEAEVIGVPSLGSWARNCAFKAQFIQDTYLRHDRPVLWVDADAVVHDYPRLLSGAEADFAVGKISGWQFASGTVYFNRTPLGQHLLKTWVRYCQQEPEVWDQIHLDRAWEEVTATQPLFTQWLPQSYVKIFDMPWEPRFVVSEGATCRAVIEHFQASRRFKDLVEPAAVVAPMRSPGDQLVNSRKACRPRTDWYDERFVLRERPPAPDPWAKSSRTRFFFSR
ncbi:hypothetical protein LP416_12615 [Polaromonas sp. P2-4]|nr:hypothetical protein LP416_12615 [Polaromonas sp. P2-4]